MGLLFIGLHKSALYNKDKLIDLPEPCIELRPASLLHLLVGHIRINLHT